MSERMIVKIQRSQAPRGMVMVYSEDGHWWGGLPDNWLNKWLGKRQKCFAYAHIDGSEFVIDGRAPEQEW